MGFAVSSAGEEGIVALAMNLFATGLSVVNDFTSPRAWAYTILGLTHYTRRFPGDSKAQRIKESLSEKLYQLYLANADEERMWFEQYLSYANASLSEALIAAGRNLNNPKMIDAGLKSLEWLIKVQTAEAGHFVPIAHTGRQRNGLRARFDQQPIEAHCTVAAYYQAYIATHNPFWREEMRRAFEWFLGRNDLGIPVYDYITGGCHDGLHPDGINGNEGAEVTLSFIAALLTMRMAQSPPTNRL